MHEKPFVIPSEKELKILRILWDQGSVRVKDVHDRLGGNQEHGYTTILSLLQAMLEKGLVRCEKSGKVHLYSAEQSKEVTQEHIIRRMIDAIFHGSAKQLVMAVLKTNRLSDDELVELRNYLETRRDV